MAARRHRCTPTLCTSTSATACTTTNRSSAKSTPVPAQNQSPNREVIAGDSGSASCAGANTSAASTSAAASTKLMTKSATPPVLSKIAGSGRSKHMHCEITAHTNRHQRTNASATASPPPVLPPAQAPPPAASRAPTHHQTEFQIGRDCP
ncbi:hypothetical protein DFP73DRAFT_599141 [Morchella snyderi]|nr:hypothetical protein DFP73DRAFT_599141 [Morchella snyderi]